ncbi:MAG TPA: hypothetical protein PK788_01390 [Gemmatimonadaceae bacterium]|nr:hypothetical protein [Gemmatimonadaceae bacterium]
MREYDQDEPEERRLPDEDVQRRLAVLREATAHSFPSGDIEEILADIGRGRAEGRE